MAVVLLFVRLLCFVSGIAFLYVSFFLTEDEEGRLQNRLAEYWIRIDDYRQRARSREALFLEEVTVVTRRLLDRLFSPREFSIQMLLVLACLCVSSTSLAWSLGIVSARSFPWPLQPREFLIWSMVSAVLAFVPTMFRSWVVRLSWFIVTPVALWCILLRHAMLTRIVEPHAVSDNVTGVALGVLTDGALLTIARMIFRSIDTSRTSVFVGALIAVFSCAALLCWPFITIGMVFGPWLQRRPEHTFVLVALSSPNIGSLLLAVFYLSFSVLLVTHRLFWPLLARPLYAAQRHDLLMQHKLLAAIGFGLLLLAFPAVEWLKTLKTIVGL